MQQTNKRTLLKRAPYILIEGAKNMSKQINLVEENKDELMELKAIAESIMKTDVYKRESKTFQAKVSQVCKEIDAIFLKGVEVTLKEFGLFLVNIKSILEDVFVRMAMQTEAVGIKAEDGNIVVVRQEA